MGNRVGKTLGALWVALAFLLTLCIVVGLPLAAKSIPWSYEKKLGNFVGGFPEFKSCPGGPGRIAFQKIISRIFPVMPEDAKLPITVEVVQDKQVNAFASLGGRIYVLSGLLRQAQSAEEVAGVIAHEIEHVRSRHILQGVLVRVLTVEAIDLALGKTGGMDPKLLEMLVNMRFSREQEAEADLEGLRRLQAAKVDVAGFRNFFERQENQTSVPALLSDHPSPENRAELTRQFDGSAIRPLLTSEEWAAIKSWCKM